MRPEGRRFNARRLLPTTCARAAPGRPTDRVAKRCWRRHESGGREGTPGKRKQANNPTDQPTWQACAKSSVSRTVRLGLCRSYCWTYAAVRSTLNSSKLWPLYRTSPCTCRPARRVRIRIRRSMQGTSAQMGRCMGGWMGGKGKEGAAGRRPGGHRVQGGLPAPPRDKHCSKATTTLDSSLGARTVQRLCAEGCPSPPPARPKAHPRTLTPSARGLRLPLSAFMKVVLPVLGGPSSSVSRPCGRQHARARACARARAFVRSCVHV